VPAAATPISGPAKTAAAEAAVRGIARQNLHAHRISFQRTRTWKESAEPDRGAKLDLG